MRRLGPAGPPSWGRLAPARLTSPGAGSVDQSILSGERMLSERPGPGTSTGGNDAFDAQIDRGTVFLRVEAPARVDLDTVATRLAASGWLGDETGDDDRGMRGLTSDLILGVGSDPRQARAAPSRRPRLDRIDRVAGGDAHAPLPRLRRSRPDRQHQHRHRGPLRSPVRGHRRRPGSGAPRDRGPGNGQGHRRPVRGRARELICHSARAPCPFRVDRGACSRGRRARHL
jgi:hypothetical protein